MDIPTDLQIVFLETCQVPMCVLRWPILFGSSVVVATRNVRNDKIAWQLLH